MASQEEWRRRAYDEWVGRTTGARSNIDQARGDEMRRAEERRNSWTASVPDPVRTNSGRWTGGKQSGRAGTQSGGSGLLAIIIIVGLIIAFGGSDEPSTPSAPRSVPAAEVGRRTFVPGAQAPERQSPPPAGSAAPARSRDASLPDWAPAETVVPPSQPGPVVPRVQTPRPQQSVAPPAPAPREQLVLRPIHKPQPVYPALARQARMAGAVRLSVWVAPNGAVQRIDALSGNPILVRAAADAVRQWKYAPYPAEYGPLTSTEVVVNFNLN